MSRAKFKAIFFDAGGTLFTPHPSVGEIYADVASSYGCSVEAKSIEKRFKEEWIKRDHKVHPTIHPQERDWWYGLVKDVFLNFEPIQEFELFFNELYDIFARPEYWKIFPEVKEVIQKLKALGFILGVVSNWDQRLIPLCEKLGLAGFFNFILASGMVGSSKPHRGIFEEALRLSQVQPHEALHIGDSLKDDVKGSSELGIHAILIDRSGERKYPVTTVKNLLEIFEWI